MSKFYKWVLVGAVVLSVSALVLAFTAKKAEPVKLGSVAIANEYQATTTANGAIPQWSILKTGEGSLGSVVITIAGVAGQTFTLYDANTVASTTTSGSHATTTIAKFKSDAAVGTYVFDTMFHYGLMFETSGASSLGTTTITWR